MKRFALISLAALAAVFASCEKTGEPKTEKLSAKDLMGKWVIVEDEGTKTLTFEESTFVLVETPKGGGEKSYVYGNYTYDNGDITWTDTKEVAGENEYVIPAESQYTRKGKVSAMYDKGVLIIDEEVDPEQSRYKNDDSVILYYKEGVKIPSDANDIQGRWNWMMRGHGDGTTVRAALIFKGNEFEYIITAWNERYTGTFTFENGYLKLNYNATWRGEMDDDGTVEWFTPPQDNPVTYVWMGYTPPIQKPFLLIDSKTAYSRGSNLNSIYVKAE